MFKEKFVIYASLYCMFTVFFLFIPTSVILDQITPLMVVSNIVIVVSLLVVMILIYIQMYKHIDFKKVNRKLLLLASIVILLTAFIARPSTSTDLISNISSFRIISHHGGNIYFEPYDEYEDDILYDSLDAKWSGETATIGPAYALFGSVLTQIANNNLLFSVYLIKLFSLLAVCAVGYLINKITKVENLAYLFVFNPIILYELVISAHYDAFMILFLVLSLYLIKKGSLLNTILSSTALSISFLIKPFTLLFIPLFLVYVFRREKHLKYSIRTSIVFLAVLVLVTGILYSPFWEGWVTLSRYVPVLNYVILQTSPIVLLGGFILALFPAYDVYNSYYFSGIFGKVLFLVMYTASVIRSFFDVTIISYESFLKYILVISILLYLLFFNWLMPWYSSYLIAVLVISIGCNLYRKLTEKMLYAVSFYSAFLYLLTT